MRTGTRGSGFLVRMRRLCGLVTCTASMVVKPGVTTVLPGCMLRSSVAFTSSAVKGLPSWNFTPGRRTNSQVVSFTFHEVARPGWSCNDVSQRGSVSYTVTNEFAVRTWVDRPGSMVVASAGWEMTIWAVWAATGKAVARTRTAASVATRMSEAVYRPRLRPGNVPRGGPKSLLRSI